MTCLEYVQKKLNDDHKNELNDRLKNNNFLSKNVAPKAGTTLIFTQGYHIGFGKIDEYLNIVTAEYSDGMELCRVLSFYDDTVRIAMTNPILKKGEKINYGKPNWNY